MDKNIMAKLAAFLVPVAISLTFGLVTGVVTLVVILLLFFGTKSITKLDLALLFVVFFIFANMYYLYFTPAVSISKNYGTVLSDNWFEALTWLKENSPECSVIATYWDPGHFITGIARRAVVFDGASQGELYTRSGVGAEGMVVEKYDSNINHIVLYGNGNKTTARIQDISTTLLTSNETLVIEILKEYRKPGCDSMYYIASSDLIGKSTWWTYFATWNPVDKKGTPYVYVSVPLSSARPDTRQNAIIYTYPVSQQESFVLYVTNSSDPVVFFQQQGTSQLLKVSRFIYFDQNGNGRFYTQNDAAIEGTLFIEPSKSSVLFIPPQLENALFTRMFLYNGAGLEHFEPVGNWGGEVKLFRVKFD